MQDDRSIPCPLPRRLCAVLAPVALGPLAGASPQLRPIAGPPPVVGDDAYMLQEDSTLVVPALEGVLANDLDRTPPEDLVAVVSSNPSNGVLTSFGLDGSFTYVPDPDFSGVDLFRYSAVDGGGTPLVEGVVTLEVSGKNDAPIAVDDSYSSSLGTTLVVDTTGGVLANDSDPDQDPLTAVLLDGPDSGVLVLDPGGGFQYSPGRGFTGTDSFQYSAFDGSASSAPATVQLTIEGENEPPRLVTGTVAFEKSSVGGGVDAAHAAVAADLDGDGEVGASDLGLLIARWGVCN